MSDTTPTPADLARELIRRMDVQKKVSNEMLLNLASLPAADYAFTHARTIAEALLAAEADNAKIREDIDMAGGCLNMIFDALTKIGCRCPADAHKATPPMMYPEWIGCAIAKREEQLAAAEARVAELEVHLQTEREMHNAWRKRAEEAEAKPAGILGLVPGMKPVNPADLAEYEREMQQAIDELVLEQKRKWWGTDSGWGKGTP